MKFMISVSRHLLLATVAGGVLLSDVSMAESTLEKGRELATDRTRGNCYSCHMAEGAEMAGNGGPPFILMSKRYPDRNALKKQIADPRIRNPQTVMPPYGAHGILTDEEIDWVVEFIHSL